VRVLICGSRNRTDREPIAAQEARRRRTAGSDVKEEVQPAKHEARGHRRDSFPLEVSVAYKRKEMGTNGTKGKSVKGVFCGG